MSSFQHGMLPGKQKSSFRPVLPAPKIPVVDAPDEEFDEPMSAEADPEQSIKVTESQPSASAQKQIAKKQALEKLLLFKQPQIKEIEISGVKFRMKRLNPDESYEVYKEVVNLPNEEQLSKIDIMTLAACLIDMDGVLIEEFYSGPQDIKSVLVKKYVELCTWDMVLLRVLSKCYTAFVNEAEKEYTPDFLSKRSPQTNTTV
jgi:hypothetical protein